MKAITSPASSMISSTLFPWLNSRRIEDVPNRMSMPSTQVWTATRASSMWQRTCVSTFARRGNAAIVRQSSNDWGDATGEVSSMYSTPKASSSFAMAILSAVVKCAFENCSPSRSVESMIANRSIGTGPPHVRRDPAWSTGLSKSKSPVRDVPPSLSESLVTRQRFAAELPPSRQSASFRKADQPKVPRRTLRLRRSHRSHRIWRKLVPPRYYCLRPHLWPATRMKLLRTSLGRGLEGCKAVRSLVRLAALRGAVTDILVADDQRFIRDMVRITLSTQGWTIAEAATPDQTVDLAHRDPPRAVLLDVNFDEDNGPTGFDVCKILKQDPATKEIPVVMLTARDSSADRKAGLAAGASHYLVKPFGPIDLINTLRGILGEPPAVQTLGQYLIDEGILTHEQLAEALERQRFYEARGHPRRLGEVLAIMRAISPDELEKALERQKKDTKS